MPQVTLVFGLSLIALGVIGYFASGAASVTALIPAFFGLLFALFGFLARKDALRKHMMHAAAVLALLAIAGTLRGVLQVPALLSGGDVERPMAVGAQAVMFVASIIFLVMSIRSFIQARAAR